MVQKYSFVIVYKYSFEIMRVCVCVCIAYKEYSFSHIVFFPIYI